MKLTKNISSYYFGSGAVSAIAEIKNVKNPGDGRGAVFFMDHYFRGRELAAGLPLDKSDELIFIDSTNEPKTDDIDNIRDTLVSKGKDDPYIIIAIGGGATLDVGKAVSNLLTNGGHAADYQGWDLVKVPGIHKVGVPTLSGTGAEASRTCVMTNSVTHLKLGMNSDFTIYDQLVLDPDLSATVPRNQYFYTGMDTCVHCIESLNGRFRHPVGDAFSQQALELCRQVFLSDDMMSDENREKIMVASYLGGSAIASSFVGVVHPFSAGLSVALGVHHGIGNCIAMVALEEFYPREVEEFLKMAEKQKVEIPSGLCAGLPDDKMEELYKSTIIHEKPLSNALGDEFKKILTPDKVKEIFMKM